MTTTTRYKVIFGKKYLKDLEKIPKVFRAQIHEKVSSLSENPRPDGSTKLQGSRKIPLYRIRYGDYRIVYTIQDGELLVLVIELGHRKDVYR